MSSRFIKSVSCRGNFSRFFSLYINKKRIRTPGVRTSVCRFCSKSNNGNDGDSVSELKKVLGSSSPLNPSKEVESNWTSNPNDAVSQTVIDFEGTEIQKPPPEQTSVIMFPGQGTEFIGMADNLIKYPVVQDMFAAASEILGYNLQKVCERGPEEKLSKTKFCQPAIVVCSLAALEKLKNEKPWAINNCVATCGYSLGEMSALVFAGCISFEKAISLVKIRAEAMQLCCEATPGGMLTVFYGPLSTLSQAIQDANDHCKSLGKENGICSVASYLFPGCKMIAGHIEALNYLILNKDKYKLRKLAKLPVAGAFHTVLMKEAGIAFEEALSKTTINDPIINVYSNLTGKRYRNGNDIKKSLPKQIYFPIKWEQIIHCVYERPKGDRFPFTYECGPGNSLSVLLKKINLSAFQSCSSVRL